MPTQDTGSGRPATRLRSRHRRFDRGRSARARLLGSLTLDAALLVGAAGWWAAGRWTVAAAWALVAVGAAVWAVLDHRAGSAESARPHRSWSDRGPLPVASVVSVLAVVGLFAVTLHGGFGQAWSDVAVVTVPAAVLTLASSWWQRRRSRPRP